MIENLDNKEDTQAIYAVSLFEEAIYGALID